MGGAGARTLAFPPFRFRSFACRGSPSRTTLDDQRPAGASTGELRLVAVNCMGSLWRGADALRHRRLVALSKQFVAAHAATAALAKHQRHSGAALRLVVATLNQDCIASLSLPLHPSIDAPRLAAVVKRYAVNSIDATTRNAEPWLRLSRRQHQPWRQRTTPQTLDMGHAWRCINHQFEIWRRCLRSADTPTKPNQCDDQG